MKLNRVLPILAIAALAAFFFSVQNSTGVDETRSSAMSTKDESTMDQEPSVQDETATASNGRSEVETEIVHGLKVRKDRNCTVDLKYVDIGDGNVIEAYSCSPNQATEPGVYDQYDDATLGGMAYSDPVAAEVLGKRLAEDDPVSARILLIRSVALRPKNTDPVRWLASASYGLVAENGKPALREMSENYLLQRIAEELGATGASDEMRRRLIDAGFQDEEFLELEEALKVDLNEIREIQLEVTGNSDLTEWQL